MHARRLAILGLTDQYLTQRVDPQKYSEWRQELQNYVVQHNMEEEPDEDYVSSSKSCRSLAPLIAAITSQLPCAIAQHSLRRAWCFAACMSNASYPVRSSRMPGRVPKGMGRLVGQRLSRCHGCIGSKGSWPHAALSAGTRGSVHAVVGGSRQAVGAGSVEAGPSIAA